MKRFNLLALATLFSIQAHAGTWSPPLTVEYAFTENSDLIVTSTLNGAQITEGCVANKWIFHGDNDERRARAYSTLLTALVSGKKVQFWVQDTCAEWNYHLIYAIKLLR